ncbi:MULTISPECIES: Sec-independent protein translocase TatB [Microbacterium]|uniref:Sec-independent protein translocase TatB n=1 Tax=Microbacterium TaxID=33882 RepID=UPI00217EFCB9|nr:MULTISPECIES: Sec-independent protein translocase TatB [Microbacterium]UWF78132.1 Sec-independent protein translocase TatB [Microbacterium neungamense]WCM56309.1 Sec-independent protein translocase TatB [Microbacterium sp. EF45047]
MELGLTFDKLLLIGLIAVIIIGPERLPKAAESFARFVRRAGEYVRDTKAKMKEELGPDIDDVDWRKLDPRQYDPRRIIRDALFEEPSFSTPVASGPVDGLDTSAAVAPSPVSRQVRTTFSRTTPPPFDAEAT